MIRATAPVLEFEGAAVETRSEFDLESILAIVEQEPEPSVSEAAAPPTNDPVEATPAPSSSLVARESLRPKLAVLAAEVEPLLARPGATVDLIVHFEVTGLPDGKSMPITEVLQLYTGGQSISTEFSSTEARLNGRHTSKTPFVVPEDAAPGLYRLKASVLSVENQGMEETAEALFEVRP